MKPDANSYVANIVDECIRRAVRDGTLLKECPELSEAVQAWVTMIAPKSDNAEAAINTYEADELIKRRLKTIFKDFWESDAFAHVVEKYTEAVLGRLVVEGKFIRETAPDGTIVYNWADDESS